MEMRGKSVLTIFKLVTTFLDEHELKMQAVDNVGNRTTVQSERIFIPEPVKNNSIQKDRLK